MHPARHCPRDVRRRADRVVILSQTGVATTIHQSHRQALQTGLHACQLVRLHFPDVYAQHVAARRVMPERLYDVAVVFLSLAHTRLLMLDPGDMLHITPNTPTAALDSPYGCISRDRALWDLSSGHMNRRLVAPRPRLYGLGREVRELFTDGRRNGLALLLWRLLADTSWSVIAADRAGMIANESLANGHLAQALGSVLPIARVTPLPALCAALDRVGIPGGPAKLGTLLAYVAGRTGNGFADYAPAENEIEGRSPIAGIDWALSPAHLGAFRIDQKAAQSWAAAYRRTDLALFRKPEVCAVIAEAVQRAAIVVRGTTSTALTYDPRQLHTLLEVT